MAIKGALIWLCSSAALSLAAAITTDDTSPINCNSKTQSFEELSADLRALVECGENLTLAWSEQQRAALLVSLRNVVDSLSKHELETNKCLDAKVPDHGGLVCVTVANKRYCKPMCNYGYDFAFLRRSHLYEECSEQTQYKWSTQYIGGNTLAVCNEASIQVSGAKSAYFPQDQNCQETKSNSDLQNTVTDTFKEELKMQGIQGQPELPSLVCGQL